MCPGIFKRKEGLANFASKQQALDTKNLSDIINIPVVNVESGKIAIESY